MKNLLKCVNNAKTSDLKKLVDQRMKEFEAVGRSDDSGIFSELCFCILTANFTAERGIMIQKAIGTGFLTLDEKSLAKKLKALGHRFPNARARYIVDARKHAKGLKAKIFSFKDMLLLREWIVKNIKGLGYKEASHFLRNIGFKDFAIIDFHIVDFLVKFDMVDEPKSLTPKKYIEIENVLRKIGKAMDHNLAELDLYLWYCETGKVLK